MPGGRAPAPRPGSLTGAARPGSLTGPQPRPGSLTQGRAPSALSSTRPVSSASPVASAAVSEGSAPADAPVVAPAVAPVPAPVAASTAAVAPVADASPEAPPAEASSPARDTSPFVGAAAVLPDAPPPAPAGAAPAPRRPTLLDQATLQSAPSAPSFDAGAFVQKLKDVFSPKVLGAIAAVVVLGGAGVFLATRDAGPADSEIKRVPRMKVSSSPPGAFVYVDGQPFGQTPATVEDLPPGRTYMLRLSKVGFKTLRQEITMRDGGSADFTLEPE